MKNMNSLMWLTSSIALSAIVGLTACGDSPEGAGGEGGTVEGGHGGSGQTGASSATMTTGTASSTGTGASSNAASGSGSGSSAASGSSSSASSSASGGGGGTFATMVQPILTASCAFVGCHGEASPREGLNLTEGKAYASLVGLKATECSDNRRRVEPGKPANSYLIQKLTGMKLCGGVRMPDGDPALPAAKIKIISDWIAAGAVEK